MARWQTLIAILSIAALSIVTLWTPGALARDVPPRNLHLVGDHWTAWNPPTVFPEGAELYTIQAGDTLWDLAGRYYENPYLWPQLWELNQYIEDAHWIYPGDPLVVGLKVVGPEEVAAVAPGEAADQEDDLADADPGDDLIRSLEDALEAPAALGTASDLYCSGFIADKGREFGYRIIGSEHEAFFPRGFKQRNKDLQGAFGPVENVKYGMATGDIVYIDGGRQAGLSPGQVYNAIAPKDVVRHPVTGEAFGQYYDQLGRVRILSVQDDQAIGEISDACGPIPLQTGLELFQPEPVPLGRLSQPRPPSFPSPAEALENAPVIIYAKNSAVSIGTDHIVYIDRGEEDDVIPGDIYTIYRMSPRAGLPPVVMGELAILSVNRHAAVAKVVDSRFPIYIGDRLELK